MKLSKGKNYKIKLKLKLILKTLVLIEQTMILN